MKTAIVGTFTKIPKKQSSHSYGWARTWSENTGVELDHENQAHDTVYLLHGANFAGSINIFSGFNEELKKSIDNLMLAQEIISLDIDMPDYGGMLKKRNDVVDKEWCDKLSEKLSNTKTLTGSDLEFEWLAVGDSHTAAYSRNNSAVFKQDGTTLFGQIKSKFEYLNHHLTKREWKGVTISLGNIDVRHHLCRINVDWKKMYDSLFAYGDSLGCEVEYSVPWPVEFEERRLPKTGYYKGQPFWGSREERAELVENIKEYMKQRVNVVQCPDEWYDIDPERYAKEKMESPQSVHLNPMVYRRMDWGQPKNNLESFFA